MSPLKIIVFLTHQYEQVTKVTQRAKKQTFVSSNLKKSYTKAQSINYLRRH